MPTVDRGAIAAKAQTLVMEFRPVGLSSSVVQARLAWILDVRELRSGICMAAGR